ncbi:alpha-amylase family glycosyl hydrolase [Vallitalea okinawensis]|uniref:alpha-amylase family glycosyl hydrolase n=1 Tax=Vallitalea okinawensis TaxID=2078660 RepID=UPI000CFD6486|nr:alpha-amylase family glycosyl hydrolase [Vallitalea okinawensis]
MEKIRQRLGFLYPDNGDQIYNDVMALIDCRGQGQVVKKTFVDEKDIMLITYGDSIINEGEMPLGTLKKFLNQYGENTVSAVHLLPMFPYTSDDGFSVVDYKAISPELGGWSEVEALADDFNLMFDAVINHSSKSSSWFKGFLSEDEAYKEHYIEANPELDYSTVTRPRALPLLTPFKTNEGTKHIWTTFSADQVDLNFKSPRVLMDVLDVLVTYAEKGARFIRLDAIGFAWKEIGTTCIHLEQTHELIKLFRDVLDACVPGTILITETNVPHKENISYFGSGFDEAQLVYQFPLPPLVYYSFIVGSTNKLMEWLKTIDTPSNATTYFNFLASHDGIGVRPTEGILTDEERGLLVSTTLENGGRVSYKDNGDGTQSPYELNISYVNAISGCETKEEFKIRKFIASQGILLSLAGVPGIYVHSLLGSTNWYEGVEESGINRRINREKLNYQKLLDELETDPLRKGIFENYKKLIKIRKNQSGFHPLAEQTVLELDDHCFSIKRHNKETNETIIVVINVSSQAVNLHNTSLEGVELLSGETIHGDLHLEPFDVCWIRTN